VYTFKLRLHTFDSRMKSHKYHKFKIDSYIVGSSAMGLAGYSIYRVRRVISASQSIPYT